MELLFIEWLELSEAVSYETDFDETAEELGLEPFPLPGIVVYQLDVNRRAYESDAFVLADLRVSEVEVKTEIPLGETGLGERITKSKFLDTVDEVLLSLIA